MDKGKEIGNQMKRANEEKEKQRKEITEEERKCMRIMDMMKIRYMFKKCFLWKDDFIIVDFYIPKPYKTCICLQKDEVRNERLRIKGYNVLEITASQMASSINSIMETMPYKVRVLRKLVWG